MRLNDRDDAGRRAASGRRGRSTVLPVLIGSLLLFTGGVPNAPVVQAQTDSISPSALAQIEALMREKESRTGVALKIDSQLLYALRMQRGVAIAQGVSALETDVA